MTDLHSLATVDALATMGISAVSTEPLSGAPRSEERRVKHAAGLPQATTNDDDLRRELDDLRSRHEALAMAERELRAQLDDLGQMGVRLEAERELYSDLFEQAPDAYLVTDRLGVVRDANSAATELFCIELRFFRGKALSTFVDPSTVDEMNGAIDYLERGRPRIIDFILRPRGGGTVYVRAHVSTTSRGAHLLWIVRPSPMAAEPPIVSEVRALPCIHEVEFVPKNEDLVADLREQLARERNAREELERVNRVKDRFIAVLSHDLRAPLSAILGWTHLLRRDQLAPEERDRAFATIERNAHMQANLIEELLDISRISADRIQLALGPVNAGALAHRAVEAVLPKARELGLEMTFSAEPALTVVADRQRLEQVLANLLSNAMKYTAAPGRIDVTVRREGSRVELIVRDTGRGIAPELLPVVFHMYTQEGTYESSRNGLGLGLFIVKQLVELQRGTVRVESAGVGHGATFTVSFPLEEDAVAAPSVHALASAVDLGDFRVLVVDDDEDSRELMVSILSRAGADVVAAPSVATALELQASFRPDVVVSDLAMPGGGGCELITKLKERDSAIVALAVSGFTSERDVARSRDAGFDMHVGKPIDAVELIGAVHDVARMRR